MADNFSVEVEVKLKETSAADVQKQLDILGKGLYLEIPTLKLSDDDIKTAVAKVQAAFDGIKLSIGLASSTAGGGLDSAVGKAAASVQTQIDSISKGLFLTIPALKIDDKEIESVVDKVQTALKNVEFNIGFASGISGSGAGSAAFDVGKAGTSAVKSVEADISAITGKVLDAVMEFGTKVRETRVFVDDDLKKVIEVFNDVGRTITKTVVKGVEGDKEIIAKTEELGKLADIQARIEALKQSINETVYNALTGRFSANDKERILDISLGIDKITESSKESIDALKELQKQLSKAISDSSRGEIAGVNSLGLDNTDANIESYVREFSGLKGAVIEVQEAFKTFRDDKTGEVLKQQTVFVEKARGEWEQYRITTSNVDNAVRILNDGLIGKNLAKELIETAKIEEKMAALKQSIAQTAENASSLGGFSKNDVANIQLIASRIDDITDSSTKSIDALKELQKQLSKAISDSSRGEIADSNIINFNDFKGKGSGIELYLRELTGLKDAVVEVKESFRLIKDDQTGEVLKQQTALIERAKGEWEQYRITTSNVDGTVRVLNDGIVGVNKSLEQQQSVKKLQESLLASITNLDSLDKSLVSEEQVTNLFNKLEEAGKSTKALSDLKKEIREVYATIKQGSIETGLSDISFGATSEEISKVVQEWKGVEASQVSIGQTVHKTSADLKQSLQQETVIIQEADGQWHKYILTIGQVSDEIRVLSKGIINANSNLANQPEVLMARQSGKVESLTNEVLNSRSSMDKSVVSERDLAAMDGLIAKLEVLKSETVATDKEIKELRDSFKEITQQIERHKANDVKISDFRQELTPKLDNIGKMNLSESDIARVGELRQKLADLSGQSETTDKDIKALRDQFKGLFEDVKRGQEIGKINIDASTTKEELGKIIAGLKSVEEESVQVVGKLRTSVDTSGQQFRVFNALIDDGTGNLQEFQFTANMVTGEFRQLDKGVKDASQSSVDLMGALKGLAAQYLSLQFAASKVREALDEMKAMDSHLTDLAKVTEITREQFNALSIAAMESANAWGRTGQDYLEASVAFARSGSSNYEELAKVSLMAQSAGNMTAELANQYMIASDAAFGFGGSTEKLTAMLDGQNQVTNRNALEMTELASATKIYAGTASIAGENVQTMTALLTTGIAATQRSGSEIAHALNTITMRIRQIKGESDGDIIDLKSMAKAEAALHNVGVEIRYSEEGIKRIKTASQVLDELAEKFKNNEINAEQLSIVLNDVAGQRQANVLAAMLQNWDLYGKAMNDFEGSFGSATREAQKDLESWQGKLNVLQNTWTEFVAKTLSSDLFKGLIDAGTVLLKMFDNLGNVVTLAAGAFLIFKRNDIVNMFEDIGNSIGNLVNLFGHHTKSAAEAASKQDLYNNKMIAGKAAASGFGAALNSVLGVIGAVMTVLSVVTMVVEGVNRAQEEAKQKAIEVGNAMNSEVKALQSVIDKISAEDMTREKIINTMSNVNEKYAQELSLLSDVNAVREKAIKLLEDEIKLKAQETIRTTGSNYAQSKDLLSNESYRVEQIYSSGQQTLDLAKQFGKSTFLDINTALDRAMGQVVEEISFSITEWHEFLGKEIERLQNNKGETSSFGSLKDLEIEYARVTEEIKKNQTIIENYEKAQTNLIAVNIANTRNLDAQQKTLFYDLSNTIDSSNLTAYEYALNSLAGQIHNDGSAFDQLTTAYANWQNAIESGDTNGIQNNANAINELKAVVINLLGYTPELRAALDNMFNMDNTQIQDTTDAIDKMFASLEKSTSGDSIKEVESWIKKLKSTTSETEKELLSSKISDWIQSIKTGLRDLYDVVGDDSEKLAAIANIEQALTIESEKFAKATDESAKKAKENAAAMKNLSAEMASLQKSYDIVVAAQKEFAESGSISADTLMSLINNDLIQYLDLVTSKTNVASTELNNIGEAARIAAIKQLQNAAAMDIEKLAAGDVEGMSILAKDAIAQVGDNALAAGSKMLTASEEANALAASLENMIKSASGDFSGADQTRFINQANAIKNAYAGIAKQISTISITAPSKVAAAKDKSKSGSGSGKSDSAKKETEPYKAEIDASFVLEQRLSRVNDLLSQNDVLFKYNDGNTDKQAELLEHRISLLKQQQTILHDINDANRAKIQENVDELNKHGIKVKYDPEINAVSFEQTAKQIEDALNAVSVGDVEESNKFRKELEKTLQNTVKLNETNVKNGSEWSKIVQTIKDADAELIQLTHDSSKLEGQIGLNTSVIENYTGPNEKVANKDKVAELYKANDEIYAQLMEKAHARAEAYRKLGYEETSKEIQQEQAAYMDAANSRKQIEQDLSAFLLEVYDERVKASNDRIYDSERQLQSLNYMLSDMKDDQVSDKIANMNSQYVLQKKIANELQDQLELLNGAYHDGGITLDEYVEKYRDLDESVQTALRSLQEIDKDVEGLVDKTVDAYYTHVFKERKKELDELKKNKEKIKKAYKEQTDEIDKQIKNLRARNKEEKEEEDRQKKLLEIEKLRTEIENTRKEKNIRQLQKNDDGSYQFNYVADQEKIDKLEEQITTKQADLAKIDKDLAYNAQIEALELRKTALNEARDAEVQDFEDRLDALEKFYKEEEDKFKEYNKLVIESTEDLKTALVNIDASMYEERLVALDEFVKEFNTRLSSVSAVSGAASKLKDSLDETDKAQAEHNDSAKATSVEAKDSESALVESYSEKDLATKKSAMDAWIKYLGDCAKQQQTIVSNMNTNLVNSVQRLSNDLNRADLSMYRDRLENLRTFVSQYNDAMSQIKIPTSGGDGSESFVSPESRSFAVGGRVQTTGIHALHENEEVLPPKEAEAFRRFAALTPEYLSAMKDTNAVLSLLAKAQETRFGESAISSPAKQAFGANGLFGVNSGDISNISNSRVEDNSVNIDKLTVVAPNIQERGGFEETIRQVRVMALQKKMS